MSLFHEALRSILQDVEKFLSVSLKNVKLKGDADSLRTSILTKINEVKVQYPQLLHVKDSVSSEPDPDEQDEYAVAEDDKDEYDDVMAEKTSTLGGNDVSNVCEIGAKDITKPEHSGFLSKKRKEKGLLGRFKQKRWCIIKDGVFYYFEQETAKKQSGDIILADYEARPAPDAKKGEYLLELVQPGKRTYQFVANSDTDMEKWIKAINKASKFKPSSYTIKGMGNQKSRPALSSEKDDDEDDSEMDYEQPDNEMKAPPLPPQDELLYEDTDTNLTYDDTAEQPPMYDGGYSTGKQEVYDDATSGQEVYNDTEQEVYHDTEASRPLVEETYDEAESSVAEQIYDDTEPGKEEGEEEIYDDCDITPQPAAVRGKLPNTSALHTQLTKHPLARPTPPIPKAPTSPSSATGPVPNRSSLFKDGKAPVVERRVKQARKEPEPENMYLGMWDCSADEQNELSFKRGELIHVINKEYDKYSWWVGELNGKRGLVPKDFLMEAYEVVIE